MVWDTFIGSLLSTTVVLTILGLALRMAWGRIQDKLEAHEKAINNLFDRMRSSEEHIAYMKGKSNGKNV